MGNSQFDVEIAAAIFFGMLIMLETGKRVGGHLIGRHGDAARTGLGTVDGAIFALMGLLIAFTFSSAWSRFETRRQLIVEEANDIGTAWLRIDLLPPSAQPAMRESFRLYLDTRLNIYQKIADADIPGAMLELDHAAVIQGEIWNQAIASLRSGEAASATPILLLPALNQMFDIATTRTESLKNHAPRVIYIMLVILALSSSLLAGYGMAGWAGRSWIHILCFSAIMAITVYVVMDLEYPRRGIIRLDGYDTVLTNLRQSMK